MNLSAPTQAVFIVSVVLVLLGVIGFFGVAPLGAYAFWLVLIGYIVLLVGVLAPGL